MRSKRPRKTPSPSNSETPFFTREGPASDHHTDAQTKTSSVQRAADDGFFQTKLAVNEPGDAFEQEADAVADAVVGGSAAESTEVQRRDLAQRQSMPEEEEPVQRQSMPEEEEMPVQRQEMEEEEVQAQPMEEEEPVQAQPMDEEEPVQAKAEPGAPSVSTQLQSRRGQGSPLPDATRAEMEGAFGTDFSGVRVHTGPDAVQLSRSLKAQAFTNGEDVYFNRNKFSPQSRDGKHLLAHELTHVVQQRGNR
jgi:hypothetical protein